MRKKIKNKIFDILENHTDYVTYLKIREGYRKCTSVNGKVNWDHAHIKSAIKSEDKYFVVRWSYPSMGLMAVARLYLLAVPWIKSLGFIPLVDWEYTDDLVKGALDENNFWKAVFVQPDIKQLLGNKLVVCGKLDKYEKICEDYWNKNVRVKHDEYVEGEKGRSYYRYMHSLAQHYLQIHPSITKEVDEEFTKLFGDSRSVLAVMLREQFTKVERDKIKDEAHKEMLKIHPISPSIEDTIRLAEETMNEWQCEHIFLVATQENTVRLFKEKFGEKVKTLKRERNEDESLILSGNFAGRSCYSMPLSEIKKCYSVDEGNSRHVAYMKEIIAASKCAYLLAAPTRGAWGALTLNGGKYKNFSFLEDKNLLSGYKGCREERE